METDRLRRQIAHNAAQLLKSRRESNFTHAKWSAARSITRSYVRPEALPTNLEIRHELQQMMAAEGFATTLDDGSGFSQREQFLLSLLVPLDRVRQDRFHHPEGDVLYHSLQVFELARQQQAWDEDFLTAALLHDIGKGIDPVDHVSATLAILKQHITDRAYWLIENLGLAHRIFDGSIGIRARRRLGQHDDADTLQLLARCDREGRMPGRPVCTAEDAIAFLNELGAENDDQWQSAD